MALMVISVAMGTAISASLITLSLDITGKVTRELRSFGANIVVEPKVEGVAGIAGQRRYLREEDLVRAKTIFWRHNILGLAPFLDGKVTLGSGAKRIETQAVGSWYSHGIPLPGEPEKFQVGIESVAPWWDVKGEWPGGSGVALGVSLASETGAKAGDTISVNDRPYKVTGTVSTGGREDHQAFFDLAELQSILGVPGAVSRVTISALTTPMDDFAYKDPATMSKAEYEKWYCTGYVTSIAKQLEEVFKGGRAKPIWQVAETEGTVLGRMSLLVYLLTAATFLTSAMGMSATMAASLLRRLDEIGLMKAVGADSLGIILIFLSEAFIIGIMGGLIGYLLSLGVSAYIGQQVFSTALTSRALLLPVSLINALLIAALGSLLPIRRALKVKPALVLKGAV